MRILIYGTGVIGSLYGALLSRVGHEVWVYARGKRLESLKQNGLLYRIRHGIQRADVRVLDHLDVDDRYDFILLAVRENQFHQALAELKDNASPTIVTMVNSLETHEQWEAICGNGRVLPAFPGAGGGFDGDVLDAALTPRLIQPTTIGRIDGKEKVLVRLFRKAGIPCQIVADMHAWQICHLALVVPLADAYYEAADPERAGCDAALMRRTALRIRANLGGLDRRGMRLSPGKLLLFRSLPTWLMGFILGVIYRSDFGHRFMYRHSMKAPDEMRRLHDAFYGEMERED